MEFQKIVDFIGTTSDNKDLPTFITKKWIKVHDQSEENYNVNKEIRIKTSVLGQIYVTLVTHLVLLKEILLLPKKHLLLMTLMHLIIQQLMQLLLIMQMIMVLVKRNWFLKTMHHLSVDVVMPMYNLLEYSKNYKKTTGSLWNYYRDQPSSTIGDNNITHSILSSESFYYKTSFMENDVTHDNLTKNDVKVVIPLKHLSNFWRHLDIPLINCEVELILTWCINR